MRSLWNDLEAARYEGELGQRLYAARLLGAAAMPLIQAGTTVSVKVAERDVFGDEYEALYVAGRDRGLEAIEAEDFQPARLERLVRLAGVEALSEERLEREIAASSLNPCASLSSDVLLHAVTPGKYVDHVFPEPVLALASLPDALRRLEDVLGDIAIVVPYAAPGRALARACAERLAAGGPAGCTGLVLMGQGVVSFGNTARETYERLVEIVTRAEQYLVEQRAQPVLAPVEALPERPMREELAGLRQAISASAGHPMIMSTLTDPQTAAFARRDDVAALTQRGPAALTHICWAGRAPMVGRDIEAFQTAQGRDHSPRVILDPAFGLAAVGHTAGEALVARDIYRRTMGIMVSAEALGGYQPAVVDDVPAGPCAACACDVDKSRMFAGEVALVTGAASGIGKACVESFLARGAAVVGLDINPHVADMLDRPDYLGIACDLTNEDALCQALETAVRAFGGLDMLVPNAGIFPSGCQIASLKTADWRKVMSINLDANLVLFREAYPLLKAAPRNGRVAVMSSRNVPAPGPGAVAYSASKAALTQIARVAALEWGKDGIRVNMLNPHAVFDTGIWTDEVLKARAAHYGMTVDQYKRNNVLRVEIASHDVGELVAEMCGPLFDKSTGAQVPIDGGSDRVI
ncbi:MAG: SDR family NAD(P)-dependent oxidoreductase [Anaerolineales bacterium]|nr:SDR family NAD(P)-dependent oxidoreductase [Anaerolineales bacterium]